MDGIKRKITETKVSTRESLKSNKKDYKKPQLKSYGKLKDIILGGSPASGDSGLPGSFEPPG